MKKIYLLSAMVLAGLFANKAQAQISIHIGFNVPVRPVYAPQPQVIYNDDFDDSDDYYYLPEVEAYYSVPLQCYFYNDGNRWVRAQYLPGAYRNYDWRSARRFEIRGRRPYMNHDAYRGRWGGNPNRGDWNHRDNYYANRGNGGYGNNGWGGRDDNRSNNGWGGRDDNRGNNGWGRRDDNRNGYGQRDGDDHGRGGWGGQQGGGQPQQPANGGQHGGWGGQQGGGQPQPSNGGGWGGQQGGGSQNNGGQQGGAQQGGGQHNGGQQGGGWGGQQGGGNQNGGGQHNGGQQGGGQQGGNSGQQGGDRNARQSGFMRPARF
ncbi:hypothetical protein [Mucilaginibacter psychrotolerans]|uniref:DUF3300 domain-containing protein n=1 Tax=Mucilaginibacter psychrotolerans TaxID=1524096 RepID=A0A4Y8S6Z5_9SPHI|nr:hypothetical protein [Mucilaginibacter psychrotolerans]TFF34682.1 hypothetical protein E2R66_21510 [Mucilaginibacter psychrotolerans]